MKRAGSRMYIYYGVLEKLRREGSPLFNIVKRALDTLSEHDMSTLKLQGSLSKIPYNVISVDPRNGKVSFMWYTDFWISAKPRLLYSIAIDLKTRSYKIIYGRDRDRNWPWNYIHRKELFLEGLEEVILDPYGGGKTLSWNTKNRCDIWIPLPWRALKINTKTDENGNLNISLGPMCRNRRVEMMIKIY